MRVVAGVVGAIMCVGVAKADPGAVVNWLMDEPTSLFDIGIFKTSQNLKENFPEAMSAHAVYDFEKNRISLVILGIPKKIISFSTKENCLMILNKVRSLGGVRDGKYAHTKFSYYASDFSHQGYSKGVVPKEHLTKLDQIMVVKVSILRDDKKSTECNGPLVSTDVFFKE